MSNDRSLATWTHLLLGVLAILLLGVIVGAAGITSTSLLIGIFLALLVHGPRS